MSLLLTPSGRSFCWRCGVFPRVCQALSGLCQELCIWTALGSVFKLPHALVVIYLSDTVTAQKYRELWAWGIALT